MTRYVDFLGNPASPHVRHWEMIMMRLDMEPVIHGIAHHFQPKSVVAHARLLGPSWVSRIPIAAAYVIAGLYLRYRSFFKEECSGFVHAHNASGYGLSAWISGLNYGVTTYGTEIYAASQRGLVYRFVLRKILHRAKFITSASSQMTQTLVHDFDIPRSRIHEFYLGISDLFYYSECRRKERRNFLNIKVDEYLWIANRRVHPLYNTLELVHAFKKYADNNPLGRLVLLEGDADHVYLERVKQEISECSRITVISGFVTQQELCGWLCAADFAISIPRSDQLSSSILEAMSCGAVPVLGNLQSYQVICAVSEFVDIQTGDLVKNLFDMFANTAQLSSPQVHRKGHDALRLVAQGFSLDNAGRAVKELYEEIISEGWDKEDYK